MMASFFCFIWQEHIYASGGYSWKTNVQGVELIKHFRSDLKGPSANQKFDVSSERSILGSPNKNILSWSFCPL